jgi:hypothetical protein
MGGATQHAYTHTRTDTHTRTHTKVRQRPSHAGTHHFFGWARPIPLPPNLPPPPTPRLPTQSHAVFGLCLYTPGSNRCEANGQG